MSTDDPDVPASDGPKLVWSGPMGPRSLAQPTRHVIDDLFATAEREVLVAGYGFDHATELFTSLFARMDQLTQQTKPALTVRVILDCSRYSRWRGKTPKQIGEASAAAFLKTCWRVDLPRPTIQYHHPSTERKHNGFAPHSMHAKCIVIDDRQALVGSANFSTRGRDNRNLEVGALIRDRSFVRALLGAWADASEDLRTVELLDT